MPLSTTISHLEGGKVEIKTQRLLLRAAREDDVPGVYEAFSDPEVMRYCTIPHDHLSTTQSWLEKNMLLAPTNGTTDFIVVLRTDPDHAIGIIGINSLESQEVGFILSRQYWGTGIAQDAFDCILVYLFRDRQMEMVTAEVEPGNARCVKFLERRGFIIVGFKEKVWQVGGSWWNAFQLRLTRKSWEERQHGPERH